MESLSLEHMTVHWKFVVMRWKRPKSKESMVDKMCYLCFVKSRQMCAEQRERGKRWNERKDRKREIEDTVIGMVWYPSEADWDGGNSNKFCLFVMDLAWLYVWRFSHDLCADTTYPYMYAYRYYFHMCNKVLTSCIKSAVCCLAATHKIIYRTKIIRATKCLHLMYIWLS